MIKIFLTLNFKKAVVFFTISLFHFSLVFAQEFSTNTALPVDLDLGVNYTACGTAGNKAFTFVVAGVGVLNSTTNQLAQINIRLDATCGSNIRDIQCWLKSPSGTCVQISNTMGTTTLYNVVPVNRIDYSFRNNLSCLNNKYPDYSAFPSTTPSASDISGRYGIFATVGDISTSFNGQNANGTWTLYFSETAVSAPCVSATALIFGDPTSTDETANGDNCVSAIIWNGAPICAMTNTKAPSANMPGQNGGLFTGPNFSGGVTCDWNNADNNDVWIRFTPSSSNVCIAISGLSNSLQSVVVTDPNTDGDNNPCTGANGGTYWTLVSCPRSGPDNIYAAVTGTNRNQNHCFVANPGQNYYLVVDGNGGAESAFYINGISGTTFVLPIELIGFDLKYKNNKIELNWATASESNNDYFTIEKSTDMEVWKNVSKIPGQGNSTQTKYYSTIDSNPFEGLSYYRLKQTDFNGQFSYTNLISSNYSSLIAENVNVFFDEASSNLMISLNSNENRTLLFTVYDFLGRNLIKHHQCVTTGINNYSIPINLKINGYYFLTITDVSGNNKPITLKFFK